MINKMNKVLAMIVSLAMLAAFAPPVMAEEEDLILQYTFDGVNMDGYVADDSGNAHMGQIFGNTKIENGYAFFDGADSYIQMPNAIAAGYSKLSFVINVRPEMDAANQFTFTLGNSNSTGYLFLNTHTYADKCRFAMTQTSYTAESEVTASSIQKESWASVAIVIDENAVAMYINGEKVSEGESSFLASALGDTTQNYLAKSQYDDPYFKGYIDDFRIYKKALNSDEIIEIANEHNEDAIRENEYIAKADLEVAADTLSIGANVISENITLPTTADYALVEWSSSNESVLSSEGVVTRQEEDTTVTLTAVVSDTKGNSTVRDFEVTVLHRYSDNEKVDYDMSHLTVVGNLEHLKENVYLPTQGEYGSIITWQSSNESVITSEGVVTQALVGGGSNSAVLTATISSGDVSVNREFNVSVDETDYAYLFAYFTGNSTNQQKMYYGLSRDGFNFRALNNGNFVLEETVGEQALRDPFIMKGQDGYYYCIVTDMDASGNRWSGDTAITTWRSSDLVTWEDQTRIDFAAIPNFGSIDRAWAPQAIWDPEYYNEETGEYGAYMIYLALRFGSGTPTQMWKVYTADMKTLISTPELFYCHNSWQQDIDSDIIYRDGLYYMYVKDESNGGVYVVTSEHAGGPYGERINALPAKDTNGNNVAIEGSCIYKLIGQDKYQLIYDAYMNGFFVMTETEDLVNFNQLGRKDYSFDFTPRHGYVITISKEECENLMAAYGSIIPEEQPEKLEPILCYDFEDETDKSGNGYDASFMSAATLREGISGGKGLYLDGSSESYVKVNSEAISSLYDYSISAWIKPEKTSATQRLFDFGTGTTRYMFFAPYDSETSSRYAITANSYNHENSIVNREQIPINRWTHVAITSNNGTVSLYLNGEKVQEMTNVSLNPYELSTNLTQCYLGKSQYTSDAMYQGYIDEFCVYNRGIDESEVKTLYLENAPFAYDIEEKDGTVTLRVSSDGAEVSALDVVIADYNADGILESIRYERLDFSEDNTQSVSLEINGTYKVFMFENIQNLKPLGY